MAVSDDVRRPIVFFGTGEFSMAALTALVEASHNIVAVVTKPDSRTGRGHKLLPPPVKIFAARHNIPVWQPDALDEIRSDVMAIGSPVGVLASYGKIIPASIIDLFSPGIINIHPSLLPKYRGPSPIEAAIVNGDERTGVSIMQLAARMDAGPVYTAKSYPLTGEETKPELYQALAQLGANLLLETLPSILEGTLQSTAQNDDDASYTPLLSKSDATLDPTIMSAAEAERRVRAYLGFPKTKVTVGGHAIIITKAHVTDTKVSELDILCSDAKYLAIDQLVAPSGRHMQAAEFIRGYLTTRQG